MTVAVKGQAVTPLTVHEDDRGSLYEILHDHDMPEGRPIRQIYLVRSPARGTIRAFHRHAKLWDFFCCVRGRAKVVLAKTPGVITAGQLAPLVAQGHVIEAKLEAHILSAEQPKLLTVPPGTFHGWMALDDDTTLLCVGSEVYVREAPDEERIDAWAFGAEVWEVKPR